MALLRSSLKALLLLLLPVALAGCNDSVACVFTTGCQGGAGGGGGPGPGGGVGANPASFPFQGQFIVDAEPRIVGSVLPAGLDVHPRSPIVVVFSESMNTQTLMGAFELVRVDPGGSGVPLPVSLLVVGDGRVLVLLPAAELVDGDYVVRAGPSAELHDLTGQALNLLAGVELTSFTVPAMPSAAPEVLAMLPAGGETEAGDSAEIVVVFDRPIDLASVNDTTFDVSVDMLPPAADPPAQPAFFGGQPEARVFRYRSVDGLGEVVPLAAGADVVVTLGAGILDDELGMPLTQTSFSFSVAPVVTPTAARLASIPTDAIGLRNLTEGDPQELMIEVDLLGAQADDRIDLYLFGRANEALEEDQVTIARVETITLDMPVTTAMFLFQDIDPVKSSAPIVPRFLDGFVSFAVRTRRGTTASAVRVLDVDPDAAGIQDPVQDTVRPSFLELTSPPGQSDLLRSAQRHLVVTGVASESLRRVEITGPSGDNGSGADAEVVGSGPDGTFIAAPVTVGILGGETIFSARAFDRALNASTVLAGTYRQLGAVSGPTFTPGDAVAVEVFDAFTLEPLANALVMVHGDDGMGMYDFFAVRPTGPDGRASVPTPLAPAVGALVTVDALGYDLFTFHGVESTSLSVPLSPSPPRVNATARGTVVSEDAVVIATVPGSDRVVGDSRRTGSEPFFPTAPCNPFQVDELSCPFGPEPILPDRLGAQSFLSGDFFQTRSLFSPILLIETFELAIGAPAQLPGVEHDGELVLPFVLTDDRAGDSELPIEQPQLTFTSAGAPGLGVLSPNPFAMGAPRITIDATVPGLSGAVPVGLGQAFDDSGGEWTVRSAIPGAVATGGFFADSLDDLRLRAELLDTDGNSTGRRPPLAALPALLEVTDVPVLGSPVPGTSSGARSYDLVFPHTLRSLDSIYGARLTDELGRGWDLWRPDPGIAPTTVTIHVPDVEAGTGTPLADGAIRCTLRGFAAAGFDPGSFLWSDVERDHDHFFRAAEVVFDQP